MNGKVDLAVSAAFGADDSVSFLNLRFENDVKMYGTQTEFLLMRNLIRFENDVKNPIHNIIKNVK